ncbi:MAG TPA: TlpA disulfide reductase family protein [bacterium]|nr:TlpA disulfide reductase family protein [bacterium]HQL62242.1 TlpA disulfide reductase family protein [bacterium]
MSQAGKRFQWGTAVGGILIAVSLLGLSASGLAVEKGDQAIPFEAKDTDGKKISLKQYEGKLVLLEFWASWCPPCKAEMPIILKVHEKYRKQGFEVIGFVQDDEAEGALDHIKENKIPWRQILDDAEYQGKFGDLYKVRAVPTCILIGPDGKVIDTLARGSRLEPLVREHIGSVTNKEPIKIEKDIPKEQESAKTE